MTFEPINKSIQIKHQKREQTLTLLKRIYFILFGILTFHSTALSQHQPAKVTYIKIAELEYVDGELFLLQELRPKIEGRNSTKGSMHLSPLPPKQAKKFLRFVKRLNLLSIQSNNDHSNGQYPFEIEYGDSAIRHRISAYRKGMSPSEAQGFDSYVSDIKKIIAYGEARQKLLRSMPDGEYQFRSLRRYELRIGPNGWDSWEKKGNEIQRIGPLLIVNGKEREWEFIEKLSPEKITSVNILKGQEAEGRYGEKGKHGVMLITTK